MGAMGELIRYFREHPWQRRLFTSSVALTLGALLGLMLYPRVQTHLLLRDLVSHDANVQSAAFRRAVLEAHRSPDALRRLEGAMDGADDATFTAIVRVLRRLGRFHTPDRNPLHIDRIRALELAGGDRSTAPPAAESRRLLLATIILSGRDNEYIRAALRTAAADPAPRVRAQAAVLAARLRDADTLRTLLGDAEGAVAGSAATAAGFADLTALRDPIVNLLTFDGNDPVPAISGAAAALARLDPEGSAPAIATALRNAPDPQLRERLLHVASRVPHDPVPATVLDLIRSTPNGQFPSAGTLLGAERLALQDAAPAVRTVLGAAVAQDPNLLEAQVLTALRAADALRLPARDDAKAICHAYWSPRFPLMLESAARVLGRQIEREQSDDSREEALTTLRLAATYAAQPDPNAPPVHTPVPSAAAAVGLWLLDPQTEYLRPDPNSPGVMKLDAESSAFYVQSVASQDSTLAGDYAAWHIGRSGRAEAFGLGLMLLPEMSAPPERRVWNNNARSAGAMLLALSARTEEQKATAIERIRSRLEGGILGGETDPYVRGAYQCALLILGERQYRDDVHGLLLTGGFPQRRAGTALAAAGDAALLDWALADLNGSLGDVVYTCVNVGLGEVLAAVAPQLPRVEPAAGEDTRLWQARMLQDYYWIHRGSVAMKR